MFLQASVIPVNGGGVPGPGGCLVEGSAPGGGGFVSHAFMTSCFLL